MTGGAGFIGSHLVDRLLAGGHEVRVIDNFKSGCLANLVQHSGNDALSIHDQDIVDNRLIAPIFEGVDWVFHLAAMADIVPSIQHPLIYHRANVDGTISILEAARNSGVKRFIYAASSSCYGVPDTYPTPEDAVAKPMYPYALTKWIGEQYALHWSQTYDLPVVSLRLFNVFGPRHRTNGTYGAVFGVFLAQKLAGEPYTVVGDGSQTRDFTFVSDIVDAFVMAASSNLKNEILNVGSDGTYSINKIVNLLGGETVFIPKRPGEPDCTWADISKIKRKLNWKPQMTLEDGVGEVLRHIDNWKGAPVWTPGSIMTATADWFKYLDKGHG